ncbi:hypothetical protein JMN32_20995 [Fulvivirga sp. 29W222]|uniref:Fungal lipase-like domain-containing protein n=1 Tax=Fulvivirga marina TaxID=2494733 RepID=A0A937KDN0_9BACT|nr:lipase family protein [Fulvivirga marina]MBL6448802.1 hypothetical protein [Fulvivirga marina]
MQDNLLQNQQQTSAASAQKVSNLDRDNLLPNSKKPNANGTASFYPTNTSLGEAFNNVGKNSISSVLNSPSVSSSPVQKKANSEDKLQLKAKNEPLQEAPAESVNASLGGTMVQAKKVPVNDDAALENEADIMGAKAARNEMVNVGGGALSQTVQKKAVIQRQTGEQELDRIAPQQAIYEYAAHHLVYQQENYALTNEEIHMLSAAGYNPAGIAWYGASAGAQTGFQAVLVPSRSDEKNSLLAIRGTIPGGGSENLLTIFTDLDPQAVGASQFANNRALIESILEDAGRQVDVTGHSLGGAMAQHVAVNYSGQVGNVATFQSPGIDQASVDRFNRLSEDERPHVVHHIVTGDLVDKAGEASLPGDVFEHDFGKSLDVRVLLSTITTSVTEIRADISLLNQTVREILGIVRPQLSLPISVFEDAQLLYQKIQLLSTIKNRIQERVQALRTYLSTTASTVGESHGMHAFGAARYNTMRSGLGMGDNVMGDNVGRSSTINHYESYPHTEQREVAEPIRKSAGRALQNIFRAYISVVQTYESTVESYNRFKQGISNAWDRFTQGVSDGMNAATDRINRAWRWLTDW